MPLFEINHIVNEQSDPNFIHSKFLFGGTFNAPRDYVFAKKNLINIFFLVS